MHPGRGTFCSMDQISPNKSCALIGAPAQSGTRARGCLMGPDALRTAGLQDMLEELGCSVEDKGNLRTPTLKQRSHSHPNVHHLAETGAWIEAISAEAYSSAAAFDMTVVLGGDHSVAAGSIPAFARYASDCDQPFYVLWLDAHPDLHLLSSTESGNLHGTPMAYCLGCDGFEGQYPPLPAVLQPERLCMMGLRSVDPAERQLISELGIEVHDMRRIDENGIAEPLARFLDRVAADNGRLHVSLDVDFLDPSIACAVGTTVPGGATFREAHLIMEMLHDSGLVTSLDLVELNPAMDDRAKTARLMVDLTASLMGRTILDRPTRTH